jgi:hypothetical protein
MFRTYIIFAIFAAFTCMAIAQNNSMTKDADTKAEISALKDQVKALLDRIEVLEQKQQENTQTTEIPPTAAATNLPNISSIWTGAAVASSDHGNRERGKFETNEWEIAFQSGVYPGINFNGFLGLGKDDKGGGFAAAIEEANVDMPKLGNTNFGSRLGVFRTPFGKFNIMHTHSRLYADTPLVIADMFGPDGLIGNGADVSYLFPVKNAFLIAEVGQHTLYEGESLGFDGTFQNARVAFAPVINDDNELEIGLNGLRGKASPVEAGFKGDEIRVLGADVTYRHYFPAPSKRILLQGEYLNHRRDTPGADTTRSGYYLLGSYRMDRYWEYGIRYDESQRPFTGDFETDLGDGRDRALSGIITYNLSEQSFVRFQLRDRRFIGEDDNWDAFLQFTFGFGPHSHNLQ